MSRRVLVSLGLLSLAVLAGVAWWLVAPHGPRVLEPGTPLPMGQPVEMRFRDGKTGDSETWKLEKKTTTREESVGTVKLPEPDPAGAKSRAPRIGPGPRRARPGGLEAGRRPEGAPALRAGRRGRPGRSRAALPLRAAPDARHRLRRGPAAARARGRAGPRRPAGLARPPVALRAHPDPRPGLAGAGTGRRRWPAAAPSRKTSWASTRSRDATWNPVTAPEHPPGTVSFGISLPTSVIA